MAQAKVINITQQQVQPLDFQSAFLRLEEDINDLLHMSSIASNEVEDTLQAVMQGRGMSSATHDRALFAAFQVSRMASELKEKYYGLHSEASQH